MRGAGGAWKPLSDRPARTGDRPCGPRSAVPGRLRGPRLTVALAIGVAILALPLAVPAAGSSGATPPSVATASSTNGTASVSASDWTTYLFDPDRTGHPSYPAGFDVANASSLSPEWEYATGGFISTQTIVANGTAYVGSWDGYEYALNAATGQRIWRTYLNLTVTANCKTPRGVSSSATVVGNNLYLGGGGQYWYDLDAATGATLWKVYTGNNSLTGGHYNWASPLIYGGYAYIGIASDCDAPLVQGGLLQVSLSTHQVVHEFNTSTTSSHGASIWGSPTVDPLTGLVYVATGNGGKYGSSVLALNATTLALQGNWSVPANQSLSDGDFGDTPTIFTDTAGHRYVGVANKNGWFYAFNDSDVARGPVWERSIAFSGNCPECSQGSISPATFDGSTLYVAGGETTIGGITYLGSVRALQPSSGNVLWQVGAPGAVLAGLASLDGMVIDAAGNYVQVRDASDGDLLLNYNVGSTVDAAPSVAEGELFDSSAAGVLYAFEPAGGHWLHLFTPPGVQNGSVAYDGTDHYTVAFGGCASDLCPSAETWTWSAGRWSNRTPSTINATDSPSARLDASLTYDAQDGYLLLFGGYAPGAGPLSDTWKFQGGAWTKLSPTASPSARSGASMTYDATRDAVVLFGGVSFTASSRTELADTWTFAKGAWTSVASIGMLAPSGRDAAGLVYYPTDSSDLLFGGRSGSSSLADTWELGSLGWTQLTPSKSPTAEYGGAMALDNSSGKVVLFGGHQGTTTVAAGTWTYSGGNWANPTTTGAPSARVAAEFAYDAADGYLFLYGGGTANGQPLGDDWKLSGTTWTHEYPSSPGGSRARAASAYDAKDGYLLVFGGASASGAYFAGSLQFTGSGYTTMCGSCVAGKTEPSARAGSAMAYDPKLGEVILFGGVGTGGLLGDTWGYAGGKWTNITPPGVSGTAYPAPRVGAALAYDTADGYLVLYGGRTSTGTSNATWTYGAGGWNHLSPAPAPQQREGAAMAPDPTTGGVVLFGGNDSKGSFADTWRFLGGSWSQVALSGGPPARSYAGASNVTDLEGSGVFLFGGIANGTYLGDAWEFTGSAWLPVDRSPAPGARASAVVAFDPALGVLVVYGGSNPSTGTLAVSGDTWTFGTTA